MKIGYRKPSIKKSISSRTTGRISRSVNKAVNPIYGKKGAGIINDPKKLYTTKYTTILLIVYWTCFQIQMLLVVLDAVAQAS